MTAEITFDTSVSEEGQPHIEGCFRLPGGSWQVFYVTSRWRGRPWQGPPQVIKEQVWRSGITGVEFRSQDDLTLDKAFVKKSLSETLGVTEWLAVSGPDSLQLK